VLENGDAKNCRLAPPEIKQISIKPRGKEEDKKAKKQPKGNGVTDWAEVDSDGEEESDNDQTNEEYEALLER
jgi:RNA-binding protein NOB1